MPNRLHSALALLPFVALCFAAAWVGFRITQPAIESGWYNTQIERPSWTPPNWVFGPVWAVLYLSMAVAAWLVWLEKGLLGAKAAFAAFIAQLALSAAWSWFFFELRNFGAAFFELMLLWLATAVMAGLFEKARKGTGWVLIPHLLWVGFAAALNLQFWKLNS